MACSHDAQCDVPWNHLDYLTQEEADQIREQFQRSAVELGCQVVWTGLPREWVQRRAEYNNMQTLTTVMGPLMLKQHSACLKTSKTASEWSNYVRGASGLFAQHISRGTHVTVLTRPPPHTLNPLGASTFQIIEEPLLKGIRGGFHVSRIDMVHPTVIGAENFRYQVWPVDETEKWVAVFGHNPPLRRRLSDIKSPSNARQLPFSECLEKITSMKQETVKTQGLGIQELQEQKRERQRAEQDRVKAKVKQDKAKVKQDKAKVKQDKAKVKQDKAKQEKAKQEKVKQEKVKQEKAKQEKAKQEKSKQDKAKKDKAKGERAERVKARQAKL